MHVDAAVELRLVLLRRLRLREGNAVDGQPSDQREEGDPPRTPDLSNQRHRFAPILIEDTLFYPETVGEGSGWISWGAVTDCGIVIHEADDGGRFFLVLGNCFRCSDPFAFGKKERGKLVAGADDEREREGTRFFGCGGPDAGFWVSQQSGLPREPLWGTRCHLRVAASSHPTTLTRIVGLGTVSFRRLGDLCLRALDSRRIEAAGRRSTRKRRDAAST